MARPGPGVAARGQAVVAVTAPAEPPPHRLGPLPAGGSPRCAFEPSSRASPPAAAVSPPRAAAWAPDAVTGRRGMPPAAGPPMTGRRSPGSAGAGSATTRPALSLGQPRSRPAPPPVDATAVQRRRARPAAGRPSAASPRRAAADPGGWPGPARVAGAGGARPWRSHRQRGRVVRPGTGRGPSGRRCLGGRRRRRRRTPAPRAPIVGGSRSASGRQVPTLGARARGVPGRRHERSAPPPRPGLRERVGVSWLVAGGSHGRRADPARPRQRGARPPPQPTPGVRVVGGCVGLRRRAGGRAGRWRRSRPATSAVGTGRPAGLGPRRRDGRAGARCPPAGPAGPASGGACVAAGAGLASAGTPEEPGPYDGARGTTGTLRHGERPPAAGSDPVSSAGMPIGIVARGSKAGFRSRAGRRPAVPPRASPRPSAGADGVPDAIRRSMSPTSGKRIGLRRPPRPARATPARPARCRRRRFGRGRGRLHAFGTRRNSGPLRSRRRPRGPRPPQRYLRHVEAGRGRRRDVTPGVRGRRSEPVRRPRTTPQPPRWPGTRTGGAASATGTGTGADTDGTGSRAGPGTDPGAAGAGATASAGAGAGAAGVGIEASAGAGSGAGAAEGRRPARSRSPRPRAGPRRPRAQASGRRRARPLTPGRRERRRRAPEPASGPRPTGPRPGPRRPKRGRGPTGAGAGRRTALVGSGAASIVPSSAGNGSRCTSANRCVHRVMAMNSDRSPRSDSARICAGSTTTTLSNSRPLAASADSSTIGARPPRSSGAHGSPARSSPAATRAGGGPAPRSRPSRRSPTSAPTRASGRRPGLAERRPDQRPHDLDGRRRHVVAAGHDDALAGGPHGVRRREPGGDRRQQPHRHLVDLGREPVAAASSAIWVGTVLRRRWRATSSQDGVRPRARALGQVAQQGHRPGPRPAPDGLELHGREVLRLVDHDVLEGGGGPLSSTSAASSIGTSCSDHCQAPTRASSGMARRSTSSSFSRPSAASASRSGSANRSRM